MILETVKDRIDAILEAEKRYLDHIKNNEKVNKRDMIRKEMLLDPTLLYKYRSMYYNYLKKLGYSGNNAWTNFYKDSVDNPKLIDTLVDMITEDNKKAKKQKKQERTEKQKETNKNETKEDNIQKENLQDIISDLNSKSELSDIEDELNTVEEVQETEKEIDKKIEEKQEINSESTKFKPNIWFWILIAGVLIIPVITFLVLHKNKEKSTETKTVDEYYQSMFDSNEYDLYTMVQKGYKPPEF